VIINLFPNVTPRRGPNARISFVYLNNTVVHKSVFYTGYIGPEGRFSGVVTCKPEAGAR
jgi:hypothetical protein